MTARTTGGSPNPGRSPGSGGTPKRPTKRPAAGRSTTGSAKDNPVGLTVVGGTAALKPAPADDVEPVVVEPVEPEAVELEVVEAEAAELEVVEAEAAEVEIGEAEPVEAEPVEAEAVEAAAGAVAAEPVAEPVDAVVEPVEADVVDLPVPEVEAEVEADDETPDVVIDLTTLDEAADTDEADDEPAATAPSADPAGVPPIDANVLLRAILTPPAGIASGEGLTDALTGAVPTWRLDEEPIYLQTIRDLGVPAVPEADGGTGEVIVGEIVEQEA
jgi:hypothetical protein